jgi:hypothetical protein
MSIVTIATTKGGAGKTTLARLILGRSALSGLKAAARAHREGGRQSWPAGSQDPATPARGVSGDELHGDRANLRSCRRPVLEFPRRP